MGSLSGLTTKDKTSSRLLTLKAAKKKEVYDGTDYIFTNLYNVFAGIVWVLYV